jgi:ribonuclease D
MNCVQQITTQNRSAAQSTALWHAGVVPSLAALLQSNAILKCGVNINGDSHKLHLDHGFHVSGMVDLNREYALRAKYYVEGEHVGHTLADLCEQLLSCRLPKPQEVRCGKWNAWRLSEEQQVYAARDAFASLRVAEAMQSLPLLRDPDASLLRRVELPRGVREEEEAGPPTSRPPVAKHTGNVLRSTSPDTRC